MKIVSPNDTEHEIIFIPRGYINGDVVLELYNEETSVTTTHELTPITVDGYVYLNFEQEFINKSNYQIKVTSNTDIIYRGKLFVTDQISDLQDYKITKDVFTL